MEVAYKVKIIEVIELKEWCERKPIIEYSPFDDLYEKLSAINGIEDTRAFLNPTEENIYNPYLLLNIDLACDKIKRAAETNQKIVIMADIDSDGCVSAAFMYRYLTNFTGNVSYIHAQRSSGHGLHTVIDKIPSGTDLLIIVDSSSSEWKECRKLKEQGIEIIIIDHHPIEEENRHCVLINPQQDGDPYPNKSISGAGLVWKVCSVLDDYLLTDYSNDYIDLAAVGIYADMMDMKEIENRYIVKMGLDHVKNKGLLALLKVKGKNPKYISSTNIGYDIAPLINAAARQGKIELALELLTCDDDKRCQELAKEINKLNEERKKEQSIHIARLMQEVNEDDKILIFVDEGISKAYSGLIANDLSQKHQRPTLILSQDKGKGDLYNGSYRSYGGFDLKSYFNSLTTVESTGGHPGAGGVSVKFANLNAFTEESKNGLADVVFEQTVDYDLEIEMDDINEDFIKKVNYFYRISGENFREAQFLIRNVPVESKELLGKEAKETLKITSNGIALMKFKVKEEILEAILEDKTIDVIGTLNLNVFPKRIKGTNKYEVIKTNQIFITDFKVS